MSLGHKQLSRRRGAAAGTGVERAHRAFSCRTAGEICRRWCEAFHHFVLLSCTEAACWNVSAESTQDSTCPGHCLAPLHNFVLPYGNLSDLFPGEKMVPLCFDDYNLFQPGTKDCKRRGLQSLAAAIAGITTYNRVDK